MADQTKPELRQDDNPRGDKPHVNANDSGPPDNSQQLATPEHRQTDTPEDNRSTRSDERTPEEIEADREWNEWLAEQRKEFDRRKAVEHTEILDNAQSTPNYRRAVADFDPESSEPQLAEFWEYTDAEYDRDGYF